METACVCWINYDESTQNSGFCYAFWLDDGTLDAYIAWLTSFNFAISMEIMSTFLSFHPTTILEKRAVM